MKQVKEFKAQELMDKVIERRTSLFTELELNGDVYTVAIHGQKPFMVINENAEWMAYVLKNDEAEITDYKSFSHLKANELVKKLDTLMQSLV